MAKAKTAEVVENQVEGEVAAEKEKDDRYRLLTIDAEASEFAYGDSSKVGSVEKRIDYIRAAWGNKKARGDIARELSRLTGNKVPYQIVFSATKGIPGGPVAAEAPEAAE